MNAFQAHALAHPIGTLGQMLLMPFPLAKNSEYLEFEDRAQQFDPPWLLTLGVSTGGSFPKWHAYIQQRDANGLIHVTRWGRSAINEARRRLAHALSGVGQGDIAEMRNRTAIHRSRRLSPEEKDTLSAAEFMVIVPSRNLFLNAEIFEFLKANI